MERKLETYTIYKITSPENISYIGATKSTPKKRLRQHFSETKRSPNHPFYAAILKFGRENFTVEVLDTCHTKDEAQELEIYHIAKVGLDNLYNISPGGYHDMETAYRIHHNMLVHDVSYRRNYLASVSKAQRKIWDDLSADLEKKNDRMQRSVLKMRDWWVRNPREAWRITNRAMRVAAKVNTTNGSKQALRDIKDSKTLKERLLEKHKGKSLSKSRGVTRVWANRTKAEMSEVRKNLSIGGKRFWDDLKADPVRYKEFNDMVQAIRRERREQKIAKAEAVVRAKYEG